jgi:DNA-binding Lrp family transcriptional regulator
MDKLKSVDYELLFEMLKNARRSDRELAKILEVSQPTVSRRRVYVEKHLIDGYTAVPKWESLRYCLFVMTFTKIKEAVATRKEYASVRKKGLKWLRNQPNVIMSGGCRGREADAFMISIHQTYGDYDEFMRNFRLEWGDIIENSDSVIANLCGQEVVKPFHFKYLADAKIEKVGRAVTDRRRRPPT